MNKIGSTLKLALHMIAVLIVVMLTPSAGVAAKFKVLYDFDPNGGGVNPYSTLIVDAAGNLYGTASGGDNACWCGTLFRLAPNGTYTNLHSFTGGSDGANPRSGVIADTANNLYGTTNAGGSDGCGGAGCGIVFELTTDGTEHLLHVFNGTDGQEPWGALVAGAKGIFYGTTRFGGANGQGVLYALKPTGKEIVLHSFAGSDGDQPYGNLLYEKGMLYGTTSGGGTVDRGTVFKFNIKKAKLTTLYSFKQGSDGAGPDGGLIRDSFGNLVGTSSFGGDSNRGTVFSLAANGTLTPLHSFSDGDDGGSPNSTLIMDGAGNLYGTDTHDSADGGGAAFKLDPGGTLTLLHNFSDGTDGGWQHGGLVAGKKGKLYGTSVVGGAHGYGVIYMVTQ